MTEVNLPTTRRPQRTITTGIKMGEVDDPIVASSPLGGALHSSASKDEALAFYKAQYEQLESELAEFQASSRELETELERDVEEAEKRERQLREKVESLGYEVDEWKVSVDQALLVEE